MIMFGYIKSLSIRLLSYFTTGSFSESLGSNSEGCMR